MNVNSLSKYGITVDNDFKIKKFDKYKLMHQVRKHICEKFGVEQHDYSVVLYKERIYNQIMVQRAKKDNFPINQIEKFKEMGTVYIKDLELPFSHAYYVIIVDGNIGSFNFLLGLSEEVTHGEHMCYHIKKLGSYKSYNKSFHPITEEFIGSLGRRLIEKDIELEFKGELNLEKLEKLDIKKTFWPYHYIGYQISKQVGKWLDKKNEEESRNFLHSIFTTPQTEVWKILKEQESLDIEIDYPFPETFNRHLKEAGMEVLFNNNSL